MCSIETHLMLSDLDSLPACLAWLGGVLSVPPGKETRGSPNTDSIGMADVEKVNVYIKGVSTYETKYLLSPREGSTFRMCACWLTF